MGREGNKIFGNALFFFFVFFFVENGFSIEKYNKNRIDNRNADNNIFFLLQNENLLDTRNYISDILLFVFKNIYPLS